MSKKLDQMEEVQIGDTMVYVFWLCVGYLFLQYGFWEEDIEEEGEDDE